MGTKRRADNGKHNLQQRVTELETALLSISQKLDTTPRTIESENSATEAVQRLRSGIPLSTSVASAGANPEALLKHAPVLSLFDNAILSRQPDESTGKSPNEARPPQPETQNDPNSRIENIRRALLSLFPPPEWEEAILNASHTWWAIWQDLFPNIFGPGSFSNVAHFVAGLKASGSVQKIAKALLCLCVILQEGSASLNTSHDRADEADQTSMALSIIDDMVLADDELAGTIDGIECMVLRAKYESNGGRLRRAWLTYRRGISFAQLLGLHKRLTSSGSSTGLSLRGEVLWKALYLGDRYLSLLLGLPYGPSEIHSDIGRDSELSAKGIQVQHPHEPYLFRLSHIVGHIIDRNQHLPSNNMLPLTFKIDAELIELAASMPSHWWDSGLGSGDLANQVYSWSIPQFWHHQARTLLHLPFMLKATTDRRFEYNRIATLESAREMIAFYRVIRPVQGYDSLICKVVDFQVFTAAMILVLNLLDQHRKTDEAFDHHQAESDQDLITETTEILQRAAFETDGVVATQAARALEIFSNIKGMFLSVGMPVEECIKKVVIPYFGTVVIGPGTIFRDQAQAQKLKAMPEPQQLPTPSNQSLTGSTPETTPSTNPLMAPMVPLDPDHGDDVQSMGTNGDIFAGISFDLDQDWKWFWDNIDIPSVDLQGTIT